MTALVKRSSWIWGGAIALVVIVGGWLVLHGRGKTKTTYDTMPVTKSHLTAKVTASGTLSALVTVQVGAQVSGRLSEIDVDFNSPVKKGQVLAKIDPSVLQASVEQAQANLTAAEGKLEQSKAQATDASRNFERQKTLRQQNLIAQADLDTAEANAAAAAAAVKMNEGGLAQAKAELHQAVTNLSYATIVSPIDGTVISRAVDVGQTVQSSFSAPTLFTIAQDLRSMQVDTNVAEADVGRLSPGMKASFFVDAYPNRRFDGSVRQVRNAATTLNNVVTYDAVIDVANPDLALKPGMTATVTFVYAERDDVVCVPNAALRFRPPADLFEKSDKAGGGGKKKHGGDGAVASADGTGGGGHHHDKGAASDAPVATGGTAGSFTAREPAQPDEERTVWVLEGKKPKPVQIVTGVSDGTNTEVVSGELQEGDLVVTGVHAGAGNAGDQQPKGQMRRLF